MYLPLDEQDKQMVINCGYKQPMQNILNGLFLKSELMSKKKKKSQQVCFPMIQKKKSLDIS